MFDATTRYALISNSPADVVKIIESMEINDKKSEYNRGRHTKKGGILEIKTSDALLAQRKLLTITMEDLTKHTTKIRQKLKAIQEEHVNQVMKYKSYL